MTRLIDADKIPWTDLSDCRGLCYVTFLEKVQRLPAVDAVPVSYIQQRIDRLRLLAEYEAEANGGYKGDASAGLFELKKILSMWENEKEKQNE